MRIVFMGTPEFAVPCLQAVIDAGHEICGVFTQPDKPKGRGYALAPPPVKELACRYGLEVFQPETLKDGAALSILQEKSPDAVVVVAYGKILPKAILEAPPLGCVNVHASLLPKYRGAAPIQWAVLNGEETTGVTTMQMDEGLDTGDMLLTAETAIDPEETSGQLHDRLAVLGAQTLIRTMEGLETGSLHPTPQDDALSCYAPMLRKADSPVDWNRTAQQAHNWVRGMSPWPGASTRYHGKTLKIHASRVCGECLGPAGELVEKDGRIFVCCGEGALELLTVQYEGGKRMPARDFFRGHPPQTKENLSAQ